MQKGSDSRRKAVVCVFFPSLSPSRCSFFFSFFGFAIFFFLLPPPVDRRLHYGVEAAGEEQSERERSARFDKKRVAVGAARPQQMRQARREEH